MYVSYLFGQKNPNKNILDVPPKHLGRQISDQAEDTRKYVQDKTEVGKK
jgi:hypothetical protein